MYLLIIKLVFLCPSGNIETKEIKYPKTEYKEALSKLEYFDLSIGNLKEHFNDENCTLTDAIPGHRNLGGKNE